MAYREPNGDNIEGHGRMAIGNQLRTFEVSWRTGWICCRKATLQKGLNGSKISADAVECWAVGTRRGQASIDEAWSLLNGQLISDPAKGRPDKMVEWTVAQKYSKQGEHTAHIGAWFRRSLGFSAAERVARVRARARATVVKLNFILAV